MTDVYIKAQMLGFATGSVLLGMLLVLVLRAERISGKSRLGSCAAAMALTWNVGSLLKWILLLFGKEASRIANALAYSALPIQASLLLWLLPLTHFSGWRRRVGLWLRYFSVVSAIGLASCMAASVLRPAFSPQFEALEQLTAYNFMFHLAVILSLSIGVLSRQGAQRLLTRGFLLLASLQAVGLLLLRFYPGLNMNASATIEILAHQATIPAAVVVLAFLAQFRFADVFIKRSLTILAAVALVVVHATLVIDPAVRFLQSAAAQMDAVVWVVRVLLWSALILLFPALARFMNQGVDRWLFQRPVYGELLRRFTRESETLDDVERALAEAEHMVKTALDAELVKISSVDETGAPGSIAERTPVPIQTHGRLTHTMTITPGARGRKLLSDEIAFLHSMADRVGRRLESIGFEQERREQQLREVEWQRSLTEAELKALRAQVNPHFLFNTLNTIADLIGSEPEKAEAMTEHLARVFRYVLTQAEREFISVSEEFDFLSTYLEIEQARFGDRLRVEMDIDPRVASIMIPPLILQPLIENAVKHGLAPKLEGGVLRIRAIDDEDRALFRIQDDGVGWPLQTPAAAPRSQNGVGGRGLKNVTERLRALYGDRASLRVHRSTGEGTEIIVAIPKDESKNFSYRRRSVGSITVAKAAQRAS